MSIVMIIREISFRKSLIRELVIKDLKLRYGRPVLGAFWAFLSPLTTVFIFYVVFSVFLKAKIEEAPFMLYLMSAVFPWRFFHDSVVSSTTSLVDNKNLIRESGFPYYFLPLSIVLANMINFLPSLGVLIITALFMLKGLPLLIIFLPVALFIQLLFTLGLSVIFSVLYVKYRDLKYIIEIMLTLAFYLTPVFYSVSLVKNSLPPYLFKIYIYNPITGILIFYRSIILKGFYGFMAKDAGFLSVIFVCACFSLIALFLGFHIYRKKKNNINDNLSC